MMAMPTITVSGNGFEVTESLERYITEKLQKHEALFSLSTAVQVECTSEKSSRGVDNDFRVEVSVTLPKALARVSKSGADIHAVFDEVIEVLLRKLKRYKDRLNEWEGKRPWKVEYMDRMSEPVEEEVGGDFINYVPKIIERFKMDNCTPMSEAEAIEQMELVDRRCYLFKKKDTGTFAMVYKRERGGYGLVEPCE